MVNIFYSDFDPPGVERVETGFLFRRVTGRSKCQGKRKQVKNREKVVASIGRVASLDQNNQPIILGRGELNLLLREENITGRKSTFLNVAVDF